MQDFENDIFDKSDLDKTTRNKPKKKFINLEKSTKGMVIKCENIQVNYGGLLVPKKSVSFEIKSGEILQIDGVNGSGKTSIIKAIMGEVEYMGEIKIYKKPILLSQGFYLEEDMKAVDYLKNMFVIGGNSQESNTLAMQTLIQLYINPQSKISMLSSGQKQKLYISGIIAQKPDFLILDEPANHLDLSTQEMLIRWIKDVNIAILVVWHGLDLEIDKIIEIS